MKYLNTKPGSIEEVAANMSKYAAESEYQQMFKKELEKAGKGIGAMTPAEKKAFFNKIDSKYTAKNEAVDNPYAVGMAVAKKMKNDEPPLKKSTITKAHDIAKSIAKDDKKEENLQELSKAEKEKRLQRAKDMIKYYDAQKKAALKGPNKALAKKMLKNDTELEEVKEGYGEQVIKAAKMYMKDSSCTYEMAAEKYGCSAEQVKMCAKEMMKSEEAKYPHKMYSKDGKEVEAKTPEDHKKYADMGYTHTKETHSFMTKDMNKSKKDAKGEKEIVDPEPKLKQESIRDAIANVWKMSAEELEKIKTEAKYMKAQKMSQYKAEDEKNKKGTADTGSKATKVDVEPKVDYKN